MASCKKVLGKLKLKERDRHLPNPEFLKLKPLEKYDAMSIQQSYEDSARRVNDHFDYLVALRAHDEHDKQGKLFVLFVDLKSRLPKYVEERDMLNPEHNRNEQEQQANNIKTKGARVSHHQFKEYLAPAVCMTSTQKFEEGTIGHALREGNYLYVYIEPGVEGESIEITYPEFEVTNWKGVLQRLTMRRSVWLSVQTTANRCLAHCSRCTQCMCGGRGARSEWRR